MSILDNNKKKRDQKSSETEKELALAQLQDRFLGVKAPKADFLKKIVVGISPALLPKKDRVKLPTSGQTVLDVQAPILPIQPLEAVMPEIKQQEKQQEKQETPDSSPESTLPVKPVSSFDFLDVGVSSSSLKTKSFLAHFAKKDKKDPTDKDK